VQPRICGIKAARWIASAIVLAALATAGGCGGPTTTVTGKVTYRGRPVTYGSVTFLSANKMARFGVIQPDGSYTVENVPPGTVRIGVISRDPAKSRAARRKRQSSPPGNPPAASAATGWFPLPPQFETAETSGLSFTVTSGRVHYDIELK
jgi:hypothetical protein